MSNSVSIAIGTNTAIAISKGIGWFLTGSPTLFAETVHSIADVGNQILLKVGEVRGRRGPDHEHPFGRGQEKYFWALVSAVSVFFIGCGINVYHGIDALLHHAGEGSFSLLVIGLLLFALALESWTFIVALRELGGVRGIRENRHNTTVLAVLLEDTVALIGILLTLIVAGSSYVLGPHPEFDASIAIVVGLLLGVMAIFLAALNRSLLIDVSDTSVDRAAREWLESHGINARVQSLVLDDDSVVVFVRTSGEIGDSFAIGEALKAYVRATQDKVAADVYWQFSNGSPPQSAATCASSSASPS
jgi:solute carrier family 30 (zinc transporter), member 9